MTVQEQGFLDVQDIYHHALCIGREVIARRGLSNYPLLSKDFNWRFKRVTVERRQA